MRADRFLLQELATHSLTQRKLNEPTPHLRIPRKQYTAVFKSFSHPLKAYRMYEAMRFARDNRSALEAKIDDPLVGSIVKNLPALEAALDPSKRNFLKHHYRYRTHAFRRRGASATQKTLFALLESSGRSISEVKGHWSPKRVDSRVREHLASILKPGDVLITRHDHALSNLFLPGYWPHAALYIGSEQDRHAIGIELDEARALRWSGSVHVLEALKDGVLFRSLETALAVDVVAVIRPRLTEEQVAQAITRAVSHEGKLYNFDFDFFRSDRLVCSEVVYRAMDGLGPIRFTLEQRAGRPTLSAEDLVVLALEDEMFEPLAIFGATSCPNELVLGSQVSQKMAATLMNH